MVLREVFVQTSECRQQRVQQTFPVWEAVLLVESHWEMASEGKGWRNMWELSLLWTVHIHAGVSAKYSPVPFLWGVDEHLVQDHLHFHSPFFCLLLRVTADRR